LFLFLFHRGNVSHIYTVVEKGVEAAGLGDPFYEPPPGQTADKRRRVEDRSQS
jgi:hypothetical protein